MKSELSVSVEECFLTIGFCVRQSKYVQMFEQETSVAARRETQPCKLVCVGWVTRGTFATRAFLKPGSCGSFGSKCQ